MIKFENKKETLLKRKEILEDEIKGLKKGIKEMKRDLKRKEEKVKEIKIEVQNLEKQNDSTSDITEEENTISEEIIEDEETFEEQPREQSNKRKEQEDEQPRRIEKKRKIEEIIENLSKEIENEKEMDNGLQLETETLIRLFEEAENVIEWSEGLNELKKYKIYNYAESFQMRLDKEKEGNFLKESAARTKVYREMIKVGNLNEEDYGKLKKSTQRAEKFYKVIRAAGGKEKIRFLKEISVNAVIKLTKEEIEYAIRKINFREEI